MLVTSVPLSIDLYNAESYLNFVFQLEDSAFKKLGKFLKDDPYFLEKDIYSNYQNNIYSSDKIFRELDYLIKIIKKIFLCY